jgi:hypothetical protein
VVVPFVVVGSEVPVSEPEAGLGPSSG